MDELIEALVAVLDLASALTSSRAFWTVVVVVLLVILALVLL
jgi:hypothetical protein